MIKLPRSRRGISGIIWIILIAIAIAAIVIALSWSYYHTEEITATVKGHHIDFGEGKSYYVVVTDKGNFEVNRPFWAWSDEMNPDTIWAQIKDGNTYTFTVYGWRFDWPLYWYPLIMGIHEAT